MVSARHIYLSADGCPRSVPAQPPCFMILLKVSNDVTTFFRLGPVAFHNHALFDVIHTSVWPLLVNKAITYLEFQTPRPTGLCVHMTFHMSDVTSFALKLSCRAWDPSPAYVTQVLFT